jgi:hypothetical protein
VAKSLECVAEEPGFVVEETPQLRDLHFISAVLRHALDLQLIVL